MNEAGYPRGEKTRANIIEAAHLLFVERGYHGTSMRQIAEEADIVVSAIYNHFDSKEDIFQDVLREHHPYRDVLPAIQAAQGDTVDAFVRDAARRMVAKFGDRLDFLNLMFIELVEFKGVHVPELFELILPQVTSSGERFLQLEGRLRPIPLPIIMRAFLGLFFSYTIADLLTRHQFPPEMTQNELDYFVDIYLHGIMADSSPG